MSQAAIRFETFGLPQPPDPARMDVACFVGLISQREGALLPAALLRDLAHGFGDREADLQTPGGLANRPVPVTSVSELEAIFDPDARLERRAVIEGGPLPTTLPGSGVPEILSIVVDGTIHEVDLLPLPQTAQEAAARIAAAGLGLEVGAETGPGGDFLRIALPVNRGPGTLAVLPYPSLGFPETRRARQRTLPSAMGQAVRQFFAMGGRKAVIVAMGGPIAYDSARSERLSALLRILVEPAAAPATPAGVVDALNRTVISPVAPARTRYGVSHLLGLPEVTFVLLPDLPELVAPPPGLAALRPEPEAPKEVFAECLPAPAGAGEADDTPYLAPLLDGAGHTVWTNAVIFVLDLLRAHVRDTLLIAALPRAARELPAIAPPQSAFLQLAEGWLRSPYSAASPERLLAPDAALAGHLAMLALMRGTFLSGAALALAPLNDVELRDGRTQAPTCRFLTDLHGPRLAADRTTSADPAWADGPVSRLMALLLREARQLGQEIAFEPNGQQLWARVRDELRGLMEAVRSAGALAGTGAGDSYTVRCDASTMSPQDIEAGRLIAEVTFLPAVPVARITVRLPLTESPGQVTGRGGRA